MELSKCGSSFTQCAEKYGKTGEFGNAVKEYIKMKTENSALIIKNCLEVYNVTIDLSIFDPDSPGGAQFYVTLYELFSALEPQSQLAWDCVDVLTNACRNYSARQALIHTYQFLPLLSRLLCNQLSTIKKRKLLRLLQDVTCGIKLSWQITHLQHLLSMLTEWVQGEDQDITCLSLGVLVNVCYKNLHSIYTLSRVVDVKKFLRYCLSLKGPLMEIHVAKLMIIMDHSHEEIPKKTLLNLIEPTFSSVIESFTENDPVMLRMVIEFFWDMVTTENTDFFKEYQHYNEQLSKLIQLVNEKTTTSNLTMADPECINLILQFIHTIETNKLGNLSSLYPDIMRLALAWINSDRVSYQSLLVLTEVTHNSIQIDNGGDDKTLKILTAKLPLFLSYLTNAPVNMADYKRMGSLLQLLRIMVKSNCIRNEMLLNINENLLQNIFQPILSNELYQIELPKLRVDGDSTTSTEVIDTYVYALGLVNDLSQYDVKWLEILSILMENRTVHEILAYALYGSGKGVKQLVFEVSKYPRFPMDKVASAMSSMESTFSSTVPRTDSSSNLFIRGMSYPILTIPQMETLDETLTKFKKLVEEQDASNIPTKKVIELYEYKIASLVHSESYTLNSIQAASDRCVNLQHRLAQLTEESNKLRQAMYQSESKLARTLKGLEEMRKVNLEAKKERDREIEKRDQIIADKEAKSKELKLQILDLKEQRSALQEQQTKLEHMINKLEENGQRYEKELLKREEKIRNASIHIDTLNQQNQDLQKLLSQKETKLLDVTKQYNEMKEVITHITKVASSQLP